MPDDTRAPEAAWGTSAHREPRWPATLAVLAGLALYWGLPDTLIALPALKWLLPVLELALLIPLTIAAPYRSQDEPRWQRYGAIALIALINAANVISLVLLVRALLQGTANGHAIVGAQLLMGALFIWLTNVLVFALWYWELDRGGTG